jgi:hypothetical protein
MKHVVDTQLILGNTVSALPYTEYVKAVNMCTKALSGGLKVKRNLL